MLEVPKLSSEVLSLLEVTNPEEGPDFVKRAEKLTGETPCRRAQALREFRKKLDMVVEFTPKVDDDRFLLRFLRARKFNVEKAYKLMCNFYKVRLQNPSLYVPVGMGPKDFAQLYDLECGTILRHRNPKDGTAVIVCRFGKWRPATGHGPLDIYTPAVYAGELVMDLPEVQLNGITLIFDLQGLEYSWLIRYVTPDYISVSESTFCWFSTDFVTSRCTYVELARWRVEPIQLSLAGTGIGPCGCVDHHSPFIQ